MRDLSRDPPGSGLILGIESSCDETAAAVVRCGSAALSNVVASQIVLHAQYGGVVPELASREHLRNIVPVVRAAIAEAGVGFADLDAIAVTEGPGLAGALLVGLTFAKALALGLGKPLIAVNHLEGHIHAVLMEMRQRAEAPMETPLLALVVSGGHTHLYLAGQERASQGDAVAESAWSYRNVGRTVDDAAGEAFDKVAKLLGLGYPGGPWIDALAAKGDPLAVAFNLGQTKNRSGRGLAAAQVEGTNFDFSFSGVKTAVLRYVETHGLRQAIDARHSELANLPGARPGDAVALCDVETLNLIASFQYAVVGYLLRQTMAAADVLSVRGVVVSGGVAANAELRRRFQAEADRRGLPIAFPSLALATDNAAMIAAAAWPKLVGGDFAPEGLGASPQLRLG